MSHALRAREVARRMLSVLHRARGKKAIDPASSSWAMGTYVTVSTTLAVALLSVALVQRNGSSDPKPGDIIGHGAEEQIAEQGWRRSNTIKGDQNTTYTRDDFGSRDPATGKRWWGSDPL